MSESEIEQCTLIEITYGGISSLQGVEYFTELTYLNCDYNTLSSLDVSNNTALYELCCPGNNIGNLDVSNNSELSNLYCDDTITVKR